MLYNVMVPFNSTNCVFKYVSNNVTHYLCIHVYRLICESTVEENILKKAHQKKLLGDIAIEGGGFTTEFFQQVSI